LFSRIIVLGAYGTGACSRLGFHAARRGGISLGLGCALGLSVSTIVVAVAKALPPALGRSKMDVGRASMVRTEIVQDEKFLQEFLDEWYFFGLIGPLNPDDNNFITRWALRMGYKIKCESSEALYHHDFALLPAQPAPQDKMPLP
jgi:hypothetical protein